MGKFCHLNGYILYYNIKLITNYVHKTPSPVVKQFSFSKQFLWDIKLITNYNIMDVGNPTVFFIFLDMFVSFFPYFASTFSMFWTHFSLAYMFKQVPM